MELSEPVLVTPRQTVTTARSGETGAVDDPFFADLNSELSDKSSTVCFSCRRKSAAPLRSNADDG
jgi:hypothetical protein